MFLAGNSEELKRVTELGEEEGGCLWQAREASLVRLYLQGQAFLGRRKVSCVAVGVSPQVAVSGSYGHDTSFEL